MGGQEFTRVYLNECDSQTDKDVAGSSSRAEGCLVYDVQYDWCIFLAVSSQCSCSIWLRDVCALFHIEVIASAAFRWLSQDCICFGSAWTAFVFFSIPRSKDTLRSRLPYYVGLTLILEGSDEGRASESEDCAQ